MALSALHSAPPTASIHAHTTTPHPPSFILPQQPKPLPQSVANSFRSDTAPTAIERHHDLGPECFEKHNQLEYVATSQRMAQRKRWKQGFAQARLMYDSLQGTPPVLPSPPPSLPLPHDTAPLAGTSQVPSTTANTTTTRPKLPQKNEQESTPHVLPLPFSPPLCQVILPTTTAIQLPAQQPQQHKPNNTRRVLLPPLHRSSSLAGRKRRQVSTKVHKRSHSMIKYYFHRGRPPDDSTIRTS